MTKCVLRLILRDGPFLFALLISPLQSFSPSPIDAKQKPRKSPALLASVPPEQTQHQKSGTFRPYVWYAWDKLSSLSVLQAVDIGDSYKTKVSQPIGPTKSTTSIEIGALENVDETSPIRYARYALLETQPNTPNSIQVLNLCIFPQHKHFPVFGADFVSLPGNKHLLLLDAQPMNGNTSLAHWWENWYSLLPHESFPWGGDLPEEVQPFVSEYALWTRLGDQDDVPNLLCKDGTLYNSFSSHFDVYLDVLMNKESSVEKEPHAQDDYIRYRLANDPARPMLQRLYGPDWTEHVLETYLFPQAAEVSERKASSK